MDPTSIGRIDRQPHGGSADSDLLDFSANTNPEVPEGIFEVLEESLSDARAYPPEPPLEFRETAAEYVGATADQVIPTPGGLAAIRLALEVTLSPGDSVLVPYPSFGEYGREIRLQGASPAFVPYDELPDVDPVDHELAILCNPNNPTGDTYDPDVLREFVATARESDTTVLVDEAFLGFTDEPTLAGTDGVIVARSLTKLFGFPGLRAGFAVATGDLGDHMERARRTWNLGTSAARAGIYSMTDTEFIRETRERVWTERSRMTSTLGERFGVHPSEAPFLLLSVEETEVDAVIQAARDEGIVIRDARTFRGLHSHVRVAVKRPDENRRLEEVLLDV